MTPVFQDSSRVLFIDYFEKGKTINSEYYCALLDRLKEGITRKGPHLLKEKCIFLQDSAPDQKSIKAMVKINKSLFKLLPHLPNSAYLAHADFQLFLNLKKWLQGQRFSSNEKVKWETDGYFGGLDKLCFKRGIEMLKDRWTKCIKLKGNYAWD